MQTSIRVALISDASTHAAEAVAQRLERDGMRVLRNYPEGIPCTSGTQAASEQGALSREPAREPFKESSKEPASTLAMETPCDMASFGTVTLADVKALGDWVTAIAGRLDHLIASDNEIFPMSIETITESQFSTHVNRNAKSAFLLTKVLGETIAQSGGGSIVYLSSLHDEKPTGASVTYSAGRGAVKMLCREVSLFFGRKGVRCNLVQMGIAEETAPKLDSRLVAFNYDAPTKIPIGRFARPDDFAGAVAFLVSDEAAAVNGAELRVDGGHLLQYLDR